MDPHQMRRRCKGAHPRGAAHLAGHRLIFTWDSSVWRGGVGSIVADPAAEVWGVLWDITAEDERALDRYELVHRDVYRKETVKVRAQSDDFDALVYVATAAEWRKPSKRYLAALLRGAKAHDLPAAYVAALACVETRPI